MKIVGACVALLSLLGVGCGGSHSSSSPGVGGAGGGIGGEGIAGTLGTGGAGNPAGSTGGEATGTSGTGDAGAGGAGDAGAGGGGGAGAGGAAGAGAPIRVLVWNNALAYGTASRVSAIASFKAREQVDNIQFDTTYAHTFAVSEGPSDNTFDASVFTDDGLEPYDVVLFLNTSGNTIDDGMKDVRRAALRDFIEKKGRGFVGTHLATWGYGGGSWPWYADFIGASFVSLTNVNVPGTVEVEPPARHPILQAAAPPSPWSRQDGWLSFSPDPRTAAIPGITVLLTCADAQDTTRRACAWVHDMPPVNPGQERNGRMFYTSMGHLLSAYQETEFMDFIIAGIKWAAHRM